jgi:hypothetical protein
MTPAYDGVGEDAMEWLTSPQSPYTVVSLGGELEVATEVAGE